MPLLDAAWATPGLGVRYGTNAPWSGMPNGAELAQVDQVYQHGLDQFLDGDMSAAALSFSQAFEQYSGLLKRYPLHAPTYEAAVRAGFYQAHALGLAKDREGSEAAAARVLAAFPSARPDPAMFPPDFTGFVGELGDGREMFHVAVTAKPSSVSLSVGGTAVSSISGTADVLLPKGDSWVVAGRPGVGMRRQDLTVTGSMDVVMDLWAWPAEVSEVSCGEAMDQDGIDVLLASAPGASAVVLSTDLDAAIGEEGTALYVQTPSGALTAFVALSPGVSLSKSDAGKLAQALADATQSQSVETYRVSSDGSLTADPSLAQRVRRSASTGSHTLRLFLDVGTGFGVATEVTDPGLAPTPLFVKPDLAVSLSRGVDLGLAGRFQVVKFAALAEPYLRWRFRYLALRGGLVLGNIVHTVTVTENRDSSTSGWAGVSAGIEVPLGPARLGTTVVTPLYPAATVQMDFTLGTGFDLSL